MQPLEKKDMQGLIARGYPDLTAASFLLFKITNATPAKGYLKNLLQQNLITPAEREVIAAAQKQTDKNTSLDHALHIAFTCDGLRSLGLDEPTLRTFSREFFEGMDEELRSGLLGDVSDNEPKSWEWGSGEKKVDCMLMCYARNQQRLNQLITEQTKAAEESGLHLMRRNDTYETVLSKYGIFMEHFGFRDGISAPEMEGLRERKYENDQNPAIKAGEFVLGYKNEYGVYPDSPTVDKAKDPGNILSDAPKADKKDLGKNGTYLVFRQIEQRVFDFWDYLKNNSCEPGEEEGIPITSTEAAIRLGAKMVGRWPSGAPLVLSPTKDDPTLFNAKKFSYADKDPYGSRCPFGAHIRRTNPRDQLHSGRSTEQSRLMVRKHQLLRRGRIFGKPLVESMKPEEMLELTENDREKRGLYFICLVGHIGRQFEFIQNVWANNFVFADLCNEVDPLIAPRPRDEEPLCNEFTVQAPPLRRNYKSIPKFTQVTGGAYFFLPGLKALRFIANS